MFDPKKNGRPVGARMITLLKQLLVF